nr:acylphosphatase [Marinobacter halophilus]
MVSGKVQGVYYRATTKQKARELGLRGIVRNLPDGIAHIVLRTGEPIAVSQTDL